MFLIACKKSNDQLIEEAYGYRTEKKYDKAIEICSEVIKRNDKLQEAYYSRILLFSFKKIQTGTGRLRQSNGSTYDWNF